MIGRYHSLLDEIVGPSRSLSKECETAHRMHDPMGNLVATIREAHVLPHEIGELPFATLVGVLGEPLLRRRPYDAVALWNCSPSAIVAKRRASIWVARKHAMDARKSELYVLPSVDNATDPLVCDLFI